MTGTDKVPGKRVFTCIMAMPCETQQTLTVINDNKARIGYRDIQALAQKFMMDVENNDVRRYLETA